MNAAGWSCAISTQLLRGRLGFRGATITDSLDGAGHARGIPPNGLAIGAVNAGTDLLLVSGSEAASRGRVHRSSLQASYRRILPLKASVLRDGA